jgi:cell division protein FtsN
MSRDYKSPPPKPAASSGGKFFVGMVIGLFLGLGIALAIALYIKNGPSPFVEPPKPAEKPAKKEDPKAGMAGETKTEEKRRFDFYKILPGVEEPVTEQEIKQAAEKAGAAGPGEVYFLQAGSFQSEADADNLKAKLALLGLEANIQTADLPDKGKWHRVRVGPYTKIDEINRARATLAQNAIQANLVKIKDAAASR